MCAVSAQVETLARSTDAFVRFKLVTIAVWLFYLALVLRVLDAVVQS